MRAWFGEASTFASRSNRSSLWGSGASVSGIYFAHPKARYFSVGRLDRDQVEDYAARKGMPLPEVERWLSPNLGYDPDA